MSRKVVTLIYSRKAGSLLRKSLLAFMADRACDDGSGIWCSKQRMAEEIEASRGAVITNIKAMVAEGLLVEVGKRHHNRGWTMEYSISLNAVMKLPKALEDDPFKIEHVGEIEHVQEDDTSSENTPRRNPGEREDVQEDDTNLPETIPKPSNITREVFDYYNLKAKETGWVKCTKLTAAHKKSINARCEDHSVEGVKALIDGVEIKKKKRKQNEKKPSINLKEKATSKIKIKKPKTSPKKNQT